MQYVLYCSVLLPLTSLSPAGSEQTWSLFWHNWLKYSKVIMVDIQARSLGKIYRNIAGHYYTQLVPLKYK